MTHLRIELSSNNEIVTSSIITKLYELVYAGLDASSNLKGYITAPHAKRTQVEYLLNQYSELTINVTGEYYVEFADPNTEKLLMSTYNISGEGICPGDITQISIHNMDGYNGHPSITSFNELPLFTSITKIATQGLAGQTQLTSIDLQNINTLENYAFSDCTSLTSLGDTSNIQRIGYLVFDDCAVLTSLSFPSLTSTYRNAFENCTGLLTINLPWSQLTDQSWNSNGSLFNNCTSLVSVPNFTRNIVESSMFGTCRELQTIDLSNVTNILSNAFNECSKLNLTQNGLNWNLVLYMSSFCICDCKGVGEVELPSFTATELPCATFCINSDFTKISNIPSITSCWGGGNRNTATFESCPALRVIDLSNSTLLTDIAVWLYKNDYNSTSAIEKIVLPSSILNISNDAFWITARTTAPNFKGLICYATTPPTIKDKDLTEIATHQLFNYYPTTAGIYVPASAVTDYQTAWADCANLIHPIQDWQWDMEFVDKTFSNQEFIGAHFSSVTVKNTSGNGTIANGVFKNNANLEEVNLDGITTLRGSAFEGCTSLESIDLSNVTSVDGGAFMYDSALTDIGITNLRSHIGSFIGSLTFYQCSNLTGPFDFTGITRIGGSAFFRSGLSGELSLPDILIIDSGNAFNGTTNITKVTLGSGVTYIGSGTFSGCTSLTEVNADFSNITGDSRYIDSFLYGCTSLTTVNITGLEVIGLNFFRDCTALTTIDLSNITNISISAFLGCSALSTIDLTNVTTIGGNAFRSCSSLTTVTGLSDCRTIGSSTFLDCNHLTTIDLSNVASIGGTAFKNCSSLTTLDLSNLSSCGEYAFENCAGLRTITLSKKCKNWTDTYHRNVYSLTYGISTVNIPDIDEWDVLNKMVFPIWTGSCPFDVLSFKNVINVLFGTGLYARGNGADSINQLYLPKVQTAKTTLDFNRLNPDFGVDPLNYLSNGIHRFKTNLLYFKDITTLKENAFAGAVIDALVINNTTPPTCTNQYYATLDEYNWKLSDINIDTWGNIENASDPTANVVFTSSYSNTNYNDRKSKILQNISFIYVPDSAVNTYKAASGWTSVAARIKGINELNGGVTYPTKAAWEAAGKPLALIDEYM